MEAWKNIFPFTKVSARLGFLPIEDEAWIKTPNPYWHFLMDKQKFHPMVNIPSEQQGNPFWSQYLRDDSFGTSDKLEENSSRKTCRDGGHRESFPNEASTVLNSNDSMHSEHS